MGGLLNDLFTDARYGARFTETLVAWQREPFPWSAFLLLEYAPTVPPRCSILGLCAL